MRAVVMRMLALLLLSTVHGVLGQDAMAAIEPCLKECEWLQDNLADLIVLLPLYDKITKEGDAATFTEAEIKKVKPVCEGCVKYDKKTCGVVHCICELEGCKDGTSLFADVSKICRIAAKVEADHDQVAALTKAREEKQCDTLGMPKTEPAGSTPATSKASNAKMSSMSSILSFLLLLGVLRRGV